MNVEIKNKIFEFAYSAALRDATLQKAYAVEKKEIPLEVKNIVRRYIDDILEDKKVCFESVAKDIDNMIDQTQGKSEEELSGCDLTKIFTFGNIQKLINMTAKYMFMACYADEKLAEKFKECHCPMDSIMIGIVKKKYDEEILQKGNGNPENTKIPVEDSKVSADWSKTKWSKIGFNDYGGEIAPYSYSVYTKFQAMVSELANSEGITPLEFDFKYWNSEKQE